MGKGKLAKFADMETYENVFQYPYSVVEHVPFDLQGHWHEEYFHNDHPIVLELGCGKGEYTVGLAKMFPDVNFIGVDIKGARMWTGATEALRLGLKNVAFLRTNIEIIDRFFGQDEVQELWLTFSDPQMKNPRKRLTSTYFLERYRRFLVNDGILHLKTDSNFLFTYTDYMVKENQLPLLFATTDLYHDESIDDETRRILSIQTYYEQMWIDRGLNIKYMKFRLPQAVDSSYAVGADPRVCPNNSAESTGRHRSLPLHEPDIEIELDDYRSYHRPKRSSKDKAR
jgi:tRNA (guanine-N7-)-methyltransferase